MITRLGLEREQIPQTIHPARPQGAGAAPSRPAQPGPRALAARSPHSAILSESRKLATLSAVYLDI